VPPSTAGFSEAGLSRIDQFFEREIADKRVPGAVIAIARDGKLVHYKSYGKLSPDSNEPMPLDAVFGLASMTKIMTSVGALTLTQEGRLPLKSTLTTYYPEFATMKVGVPTGDGQYKAENPKNPIFIHDLFRHTSGLTYGGRGNNPVAAQWPASAQVMFTLSGQQFIDKITQLPLTKHPGTEFEYSFSTDVLGLVIEKVAQQRLNEFLKQRLWQPLGMQSTTFQLNQIDTKRLARPFKTNPLDGKPQAIDIINKQSSFDCGGACALGTVGDYLRFGQMLLNGGSLDGVQILSPQTVRWMTSNHLGPAIKNNVGYVEPHREGYGFGLGVAVRQEVGLAAVPGNVGEYSWNGAYGTAFFADPAEKLVVVVGTAAPGELRKYYREQVQVQVYGALLK
jgi:CubicO group peptidase (beta-lactamase class C family)